MAFQDSPLQLIYVENDELKLNHDTVTILRNFTSQGHKLHIISIIGEARGGKSTLLNFLLNHFGVHVSIGQRFINDAGGHTITKGLWIWGRPILLSNGDYLLLIDTQGTGLNNDSINTQLAALACMLSSMVIFNIEGSLNGEHRTLLSIIRSFMHKAPGTPTQRAGLFPTLLIRSRDYRKIDFENDFPRSIHQLPLGNPMVKEALDIKLISDFEELVDPILAETTRNICHAFPNRHWFFTYPTTDEDDLILDHQFIVPRESSLFGQSMHDLINYIAELSHPKQFGGANISMDVLVPHFTNFLQIIREEKTRFHIPTVIETLHAQQVNQICQLCHEIYEAKWTSLTDQPNDDIELKAQHLLAKEQAIEFYITQTNERGLNQHQVNQGRHKLDIILNNLFLPYQEEFRVLMYRKIVELQNIAEVDHARKIELDNEMKDMKIKMDNITISITQFKGEITKAEQHLKEAETQRLKAEQEYKKALEEMRNSGGDSFCVIL